MKRVAEKDAKSLKINLKKRKVSEDCVVVERDRLSDLPDEVLVHILSCLPIQEAVATMLLRRFGNLWTLVHTLDFGMHALRPSSLFLSIVLLLHKRPAIENFTFVLDEESDMNPEKHVAEIEMMMRFVKSRETKALVLDFTYSKMTKLPHFIFKCQSLSILDLKGVDFGLENQVHLEALRTLRLSNCWVDGQTISFLVDGCPVLKEVILDQLPCPLDLCLCSPSLQKLQITIPSGIVHISRIDCPKLKIAEFGVKCGPYNVEYVNVPSLEELIAHDFYDEEPSSHAISFEELLTLFGHAEVVTLFSEEFKWLDYCLQKKITLPKNRWKLINLKSKFSMTCAMGISSLLACSPFLEELNICVVLATKSDVSFNSSEGTCFYLASQTVSSTGVLPSLKRVSMNAYWNDSRCQLQLAEYILTSADKLDELVIISDAKHVMSTAEMECFKQMSNYRRASPKARVLLTLQ